MLEYEYASAARRSLAFFIDVFIIEICLITLSFIFNQEQDYNMSLIFAYFELFYFNLFYFSNWQVTPGKKLMKIRVIRENGLQLDIETVLKREVFNNIFLLFRILIILIGIENVIASNIFAIIASIISLFYLISLTYILIDHQNKSLHDYFAGTLVIKEN